MRSFSSGGAGTHQVAITIGRCHSAAADTSSPYRTLPAQRGNSWLEVQSSSPPISRHVAASLTIVSLGGARAARRRPPQKRRGGVARGAATATAAPTAVYEPTWSNPTGAVLKPLAKDLWVAERPFVWLGIDVGGKMAVVKLPCGGLWVHSPVSLDDALKAALADIGPVKHIVSPNYEHVKWAKPWKEAYPEATLWGSPGMIKKYPAIPYDQEVSTSNEVPDAWGGVFDMAFFDCETLPVLGEPLFSEVNFHHKPTRTLICTDTYWSWPDRGIPGGTLAFKWAMDKLYMPLYKSVLVYDKVAYEKVLDKIKSWDAEAMLPCHGVYEPTGATATFLSHMNMK